MSTLAEEIPAAWRGALAAELGQPWWAALERFVAAERAAHTIYPPAGSVFTALELTPPDAVRTLILGQDPYHGAGQAHGLAFSVQPGVALPPSLRNIYKELAADLGAPAPRGGSLTGWARQGVLLLNAVLTVREAQPNSHQGQGWERLSDAVIRHVSAGAQPCVFVLWGSYAQQKRALIDESRHLVIATPHPSPLSASRGFFGSRPFSTINAALQARGRPPIDWLSAAE